MKGCLITTAVLIGLFMGMTIWLARVPSVRDTMRCKTNMEEIGGALNRYSDVNGCYPANLESLKKDYLEDLSVLRCPLDKSTENSPSYIYHCPKENAKDTDVILECDRHRLYSGMPVSMLVLLKNGKFKVINPPHRKTARAPEKSLQ